jgi:hypothetical protein
MYSRAASLEMEVAIITSALGHRIVTILFYAVGILMVWMSVFLYENDLGELINVLDLASARVNRIGASTLSWQARFVQEIARLSALVFNRLLGHKLLSIRAIGVINCFSTASVCLVFSYMEIDQPGERLWAVPSACGLAIFFIALGITPSLMNLRVHKVWFTLTFSAFFVWGYFALIAASPFWGAPALNGYVVEVLIAIPFSFVCDILFVAFTRWTLRWILTREQLTSMLLILLLNCFMAFLLVGLPFVLWETDVADRLNANWTLLLLGASNVIDGFASGLIVFFASAMLLHRLFWPFLSRTVYGLKNLGVLKWRKLIGAGGIALIAIATPAGKEILEKLLEKLL